MKFEFTDLDVVLNELDKKISDEALKKSVGQACADRKSTRLNSSH